MRKKTENEKRLSFFSSVSFRQNLKPVEKCISFGFNEHTNPMKFACWTIRIQNLLGKASSFSSSFCCIPIDCMAWPQLKALKARPAPFVKCKILGDSTEMLPKKSRKFSPFFFTCSHLRDSSEFSIEAIAISFPPSSFSFPSIMGGDSRSSRFFSPRAQKNREVSWMMYELLT